jgi:hypothetical protein
VRNLISRISDSALRAVLPEASAGACVSETGQVCKCLSESSCDNGNKSSYKVYRVTCYGQCVLSETICESSCIVTV